MTGSALPRGARDGGEAQPFSANAVHHINDMNMNHPSQRMSLSSHSIGDTASPCIDRPVTVCIFGAALDTGNLGVEGLGLSILSGLRRRLPNARLIVFSGRTGRRLSHVQLPCDQGSQTISFEEIGCSLSRDPFKPGNLYVEHALHRIGCGSRSGPVSRVLSEADLILDASGGDSFTTMYGPYRYKYAVYPKRMSLRFDAPLVLLPQTYGPFDAGHADEAGHLIRSAAQVWSRDQAGSRTIERLAPEVSVGRSADMVFTLPADTSGTRAPTTSKPLVGLNVSGLLFNDEPSRVRDQFGLCCDYRQLIHDLVASILSADAEAHILFVPHVVVERSHVESDLRACETLHAMLPNEWRQRATVMPNPSSACDAKGIISRCDFFVGTRMHACIAALSSEVPVCAIAYSKKTSGVFGTVGMEHAVFDARAISTDDIVSGIMARYRARISDRQLIRERLGGAIASVDRMFDEVVSLLMNVQQRRAA